MTIFCFFFHLLDFRSDSDPLITDPNQHGSDPLHCKRSILKEGVVLKEFIEFSQYLLVRSFHDKSADLFLLSGQDVQLSKLYIFFKIKNDLTLYNII